MKKIISVFAALAVVVFSVSSCNTDEINSRELASNEVSFVISSNVATKSVDVDIETNFYELESEDGSNFILSETVSSMDDLYAQSPVTKGTPAYTENVADLYGSFEAVGYKSGALYLEKASFVENAGRWSHTYTDVTTIDWSNGIDFFMGMPSLDGCSYNVANQSISFDYVSASTASDTKDLIYAFKHVTDKNTDNNLIFYHALTAVKFATGNKKATINSVELSNVTTKGSCVIVPGQQYVAWSPANNGTGSVSQSFDGVVDFEDDGTFDQSFYVAGATNNLNDADASMTFFLIPQFTEGVTLKVTYTIDDNLYENIIDLGALTGNVEWKAGQLRTYTLTEKALDVDVTDEINNGVKENVVITNSGEVAEYVRAMVVANWVDAQGNIIAPCELDFGTLEGWILNSDGFYYCTSALNAKETIKDPFFERYEPSTPAGADHLVMDIAVQAIDASVASTYSEAWTSVAGVSFN